MKRNSAHPSDVLRLLKQPVGPTRLAVRAADYMDNAVKLIKASLVKRRRRSINATGVYPKQVLYVFHSSSFKSQLRCPFLVQT